MTTNTWDTLATVRNSERRRILGRTPGFSLFPAPLFPALTHPTIEQGNPAVAASLEARRLLLYLDFTTALESLIVNPVLASLGLDRTPLRLEPGDRVGAWQIYVDEAYHALNAVDLADQVGDLVGIDHKVHVSHRFKSVVERASDQAGVHTELVRLCAAVVSETLISGTLEKIPRDEGVHPTVRAIVKDHEMDERRHHAYFTRAFKSLWPQLEHAQREAVGPLFADFICAFLEPDMDSLLAITTMATNDADTARDIIYETRLPDSEQAHSIRYSARATLALLRRCGVLDMARTQDRFAEFQLI